MVKTSDGRWITYPRFVAELFAARCGVTLPIHGIRIETVNPQDVKPSNLIIKIHNGPRVPLTKFVHRINRGEHSQLA